MATPLLDELNVKLARRLGDPADTDGNIITTSNLVDGVAYTNSFREAMLSESLRLYLNMFGHAQVQDAGFPLNYMREKEETLTTGTEVIDLPDDVARVLYIDCYGRKAQMASFDMLKRRHHIYWQKVPMYRVSFEPGAPGKKKLHFYFYRPTSTDITIYYMRVVEDLYHNGPEDIELDSLHFPSLLSLAEALARRNHQEFGPFMQQLGSASLQSMKENL